MSSEHPLNRSDSPAMNHPFPFPKMGYSFTEILEDPLTKKLLGHDAVHAEKTPFIKGVTSRLTFLLSDPIRHLSFLKIGYTALEAFLQANATGPPLDFDSEPIIFPEMYRDESLPELKQELFDYLKVDGDAIYALTPRIELFWLAQVVMSNSTLAEAGFNGRRARFRVNFWHQKLLHEKSDKLHAELYADAEILGDQLFKRFEMNAAAAEEHFIEFLLERAEIRTYYGDDVKAREDLAWAARIRDFKFALIGVLGKRTKFQDRDISQLVILAKSRDVEPEPYSSSRKSSRADPSSRKSSNADLKGRRVSQRPDTPVSPAAVESIDSLTPYFHRKTSLREPPTSQPENIPLNDDTLHESIQFTQAPKTDNQLTQVKATADLPAELANLDPGDQAILYPADSIILLAIASSISNTSPADGLTREETLPYATRVLEGGSSNWQVYTQALLVRSRIEGYKSRTAERGLLQLQALVDQVIAETSGTSVTTKKGDEADQQSSGPTTFLPKLEISEAATVAERLKYIYQLSPPLRWELEAELAQRWTTMGGLRSALEIYERLQMQAEIALCLAATDQEAEAVQRLKSILFEDLSVSVSADSIPKLKSPQPSDAPRLLCILGDIKSEPSYYTLAWQTSNKRYARAQRSLGRYYTKNRNPTAAAEAYGLALALTRFDSSTWFALGCIHLEQELYPSAVESFTRVIQLEERDAEAYSNLAVALLRLPPPSAPAVSASAPIDEHSVPTESVTQPDPLQHTREALRALRRATNLKREDARIWDNYLTVAASIPPSQGTPWTEIIHAMTQIVELRGKREGEKAVDLKILAAVIDHVTATIEYPAYSDSDDADPTLPQPPSTTTPPANSDNTPRARLPFVARALLRLTALITPLTASPALYTLLARLSLWRQRPAESLSLHEKAWRAATSQPGIYDTTEAKWDGVVDATIALIDAYRTLGELPREGLAVTIGAASQADNGNSNEMVEKAWRFKSRNALRSVLGRGGDWEGTNGWDRLKDCEAALRS